MREADTPTSIDAKRGGRVRREAQDMRREASASLRPASAGASQRIRLSAPLALCGIRGLTRRLILMTQKG